MEALNRSLLLLAMLTPLVSCGSEEVEIPDELRGEPFCALVTGTYGHLEDGSRMLIADWSRNTVVGACVCSTHEEIATGVHDEDLNERALAKCEATAAAEGFVSNECLQSYESGEWIAVIWVCGDGFCDDVPPPDLGCVP